MRSCDECSAVSSQTRRMNTVEGVDALSDSMEDVSDTSDAQQMHRTIITDETAGEADDSMHVALTRSERSSDSCAEEVVFVYEICALNSQVFVNSTLNDAVQRLLPTRSSLEFLWIIRFLVIVERSRRGDER